MNCVKRGRFVIKHTSIKDYYLLVCCFCLGALLKHTTFLFNLFIMFSFDLNVIKRNMRPVSNQFKLLLNWSSFASLFEIGMTAIIIFSMGNHVVPKVIKPWQKLFVSVGIKLFTWIEFVMWNGCFFQLKPHLRRFFFIVKKLKECLAVSQWQPILLLYAERHKVVFLIIDIP